MHAQAEPSASQLSTQTHPVQPWYRQFWAWFVLTPLIVVIIVCAIMGTIAFRHADDVVIDNYYKEGRMINQRLEQDLVARELGLTAELHFDNTLGEVLLSLHSSGAEVFPQRLLVMLDHPTSANRDRILQLQAMAPGRYRAELTDPLQHRWYVYLMPITDVALRNEAPWRLFGEINFQLNDRIQLQAH